MSPRRVAALVGKETREFLRDPITLGLAAVMPLVLLFLFGYAVTLDVRGIELGVLDQDHTPASRELTARFAASESFTLRHQFESVQEMEDALQRTRVRLAVFIPSGFAADLARNESAPVQILIDGSYAASAALARSYAESLISSFPAPRNQVIALETRVWYNPSLRSVNFIVPGLFAVILMAFPPLLTALAIVREKETGTIQQIFASPVTSAEFIAGKLLPYTAVALLQMLVLVVIGILWFAVPFAGNPLLLLVASLIYALTTVAIGLAVSAVTRTQLMAMLLTLIVTLMPSFLFSGFLFPVFTMPFATQVYSWLVPASYFIDVSRGIVLRGVGIEALWINLLLLGIYALALFAFAAWRLKQKVA